MFGGRLPTTHEDDAEHDVDALASEDVYRDLMSVVVWEDNPIGKEHIFTFVHTMP